MRVAVGSLATARSQYHALSARGLARSRRMPLPLGFVELLARLRWQFQLCRFQCSRNFRTLGAPNYSLKSDRCGLACGTIMRSRPQRPLSSTVRHMNKRATYALLLLAIGIFSPRADGETSFKAELLDTISKSDRIVVTEHSIRDDVKDPPDDDIVYGTRELNEQQKRSLAAMIEGLQEKPNVYSLCILEPHHTIKFYSNDEPLALLDICFKCGDVQWRDAVFGPHWLMGGLASFIKEVGFEPKRDWRVLAAEHWK